MMTELSSRECRIEAFVKWFNESQTHLYKQSLQYHMRLLATDKKTLELLYTQLETTFEAHSTLQRQTRSFIDTTPLHVKETRTPVYKVKQRHYKILGLLDSFHSRTSKESELGVIQEAITHCEEALEAKKQALSNLRKAAKDELVAMFDVFLLMQQTTLAQPLLDQICHHYLRIIFSGVVLIKPIIVCVAFETLEQRMAPRLTYFSLGKIDVWKDK